MESKREWLIIMVMYIYANKALESSNNMSICRTEIWGCNSESSDNATMVMRKIKNKSLREALEIIEKNIDIMDSEHVIICQAIAYHSNEDITKTIELLNSIYKTLSNDQKLFLAEMYILQESKKEAKKYLKKYIMMISGRGGYMS